MKKEVFLLWRGDAWMGSISKQLIAVCSCEEKAIELAEQDADEIEEPFSEGDLTLLENERQTQGRDNNYLIAPVNMDELDN